MTGTPFKMKGSTFKYEREAQMRTSTGWTRLKKGIQRIKKTGERWVKSIPYGSIANSSKK